MTDSPFKSRAFIQQGNKLVEDTVTLPALGPHDVLVEVHYAAFNPTDMLAFDLNAFGDGAVLGCDFAGTVKDMGSEASNFSVGDRIAAFIWGGYEYCIADARLAFKVPENITLEQAATIPLAATTALLALYSSDCLHLDPRKSQETPILILGGSSTVGSFTNQLVKIAKIAAVSTCSPRNTDSVLADGAKRVFDYNDPDVSRKIQDSEPDLNMVFDTIGTPTSSASAEKVLTRDGATLVTVRPGKAHTGHLPSNVKICDVFVFTAFPKEHTYRGKAHWDLHQENVDLSKQFFADLPEYISTGVLKPRPVKSLGTLSVDSLMEAMELTKSGKVSNEKICFTVKG